jgi:hypothetical protein
VQRAVYSPALGDPRFLVLNHKFNPNRSFAHASLLVRQRGIPAKISDQVLQPVTHLAREPASAT